jgi:hypothetical protein
VVDSLTRHLKDELAQLQAEVDNQEENHISRVPFPTMPVCGPITKETRDLVKRLMSVDEVDLVFATFQDDMCKSKKTTLSEQVITVYGALTEGEGDEALTKVYQAAYPKTDKKAKATWNIVSKPFDSFSKFHI